MKKILSLYLWRVLAILTMVCVVFSGCINPATTSNSENDDAVNGGESTLTEEDFEIVIPSENDPSYEEYEKMVAMGKRMKTIIDNKELDEIVIVVNGRSITRRDIESAKIYVEFNFGEESLKDRINNLITDAVLETEAQKLGIEGSQEDVDAYIASEKELGFPPIIVGYIEGLEVTTGEYYKILEDMMYNSTVRNNVWLKYKEEHEAEMKNEAIERAVSLTVIEEEYREKYEMQLIENADIEIIDSEIKSLIDD